MSYPIFANHLKSMNKENILSNSNEKKGTFSHRRTPLALYRCLGNWTVNRLLEAHQKVEGQQQDDVSRQELNSDGNLNYMLSAFKKQYGISVPCDPVEHEAESVAKQIVNMKAPDSGQSQRITDNDSNVWKTPTISRQHQTSQNTQNSVNLELPKSDGQPLERSVSEYMEPRFGYTIASKMCEFMPVPNLPIFHMV